MRRLALIALAACGHKAAPPAPRDGAPAPADARVSVGVRQAQCAEVIGGAIGAPATAGTIRWRGLSSANVVDLGAGGYYCTLAAFRTTDRDEVAQFTYEGPLRGGGPSAREVVVAVQASDLFVTFTITDDLYAREMKGLADNLRPLTGERRQAACAIALARTPPDAAALTRRAAEAIQRYIDTGAVPGAALDAGNDDLLAPQLAAIRNLCGPGAP